jgi:hypothetical protein
MRRIGPVYPCNSRFSVHRPSSIAPALESGDLRSQRCLFGAGEAGVRCRTNQHQANTLGEHCRNLVKYNGKGANEANRREIRVLRKIAICGMAVLVTATLLWGGCLSCAQYFMFPSISAKTCCAAPGSCKRTPSKPSPEEECRIQPLALAKAPATPERASTLPSIAVLPAQVSASTVTLQLDLRRRAHPANQASAPDLCLLHSVLRV